MKITKTHKKIGAVALLLLLGGIAYAKFGKKKPTTITDVMIATKEDAASTPTSFQTMDGNSTDTGVKYWMDGKKYYSGAFGPLIKTAPREITEAEYIEFYKKYKA